MAKSCSGKCKRHCSSAKRSSKNKRSRGRSHRRGRGHSRTQRHSGGAMLPLSPSSSI